MKRSWIIAILLVISTIASTTVGIYVSNVLISRDEPVYKETDTKYQNSILQELQTLNEKLDILAISMVQLEEGAFAQHKDTESLKSAIANVKDEQKLSDQQKEDLQIQATEEVINQLSLQAADLQKKLTQIEENDDDLYEQSLEDKNALMQEITYVLNRIDSLDSVYQTLLANIPKESNPERESLEPEQDKKEEETPREDKPEHIHTFDTYGNCSDETCFEHQESEVFDIIDLKRAKANSNYYYHIDWDGEINFEILYAYISTDDIEVSLYIDANHSSEVPMDRIDATYTATLPEAGTYYIQVNTLTDGDVEISIF